MPETNRITRRGVGGVGLRALAWCLALLFVALPARTALAQDDAMGSESRAGSGGHGWTITRTGPDRRPAIVHLPPRSGPNAVERGTVRFAAWLNEEPAWVGTWGNQVHLAFAAETHGEGKSRRHVVALSAMPLVAGLWENQPAGRFTTLPAMTGEGDLIGFVGSVAGPAALMREADVSADGTTSPRWRMLVLSGNDWVELAMPWEGAEGAFMTPAPAEGDVVQLVAMPDGPALVVERAAGAASLLTARVQKPRRGEAIATWNEQVIRRISDPGLGTMLAIEGQLLRYRHEPGAGLVLELVRPGAGGGVYGVARYADVPPEARVIPMHATGGSGGSATLAIMWSSPAGEDGVSRGYELREVSAFSGRVWYAGSGSSGGLVATRQFQILAVALVVVMATVLLFILRPGDQTATLPEGMIVAEPSRRIAAAAADFLLGVLLASALMGTSASEMLSPAVLLGSKDAAGALLLAFWLTFAHTAAGEWLFGRSLGKLMAGCEVVRVERVATPGSPAAKGTGGEGGRVETGPSAAPSGIIAIKATVERPLLWQAVARNAVRWGLPPLALWVLADPSSRHPGDLLARTVVVVRGPEGEVGKDRHPDRGDRGEG